VRALLPEVDVFALLTNNDGMPMAIIEAMSCGIPVISTRVGGIPALIANGQTGFLVQRSGAAFAAALSSLAWISTEQN
jgi:glycosyltransferase involved in cell wall biosynthesis